MAQAHYNYAQQIPGIIEQYIVPEVRQHLSHEMVHNPIGGIAVMHTHNTLPNMSQKYKLPIWKVPDCPILSKEDRGTIAPNAKVYITLQMINIRLLQRLFWKELQL